MKKFLLATSVLVATAGVAAAEVTLSGDARMGVIDPFGEQDISFTSRARVTFTLSGESDSGLAFGGSFRADNAGGLTIQNGVDGVFDPTDPDDLNVGGATLGRAGSVFISGTFGKLSMGDVDDAALSAVGQVSGVGLTGLGDLNEISYMGTEGNFFNDPTALYEYSTNGFTFYFSMTNPSYVPFDTNDDGVIDDGEGFGTDETIAAGAKYAIDNYSFGLGYENAAFETTGGQENIVLGASGTWGGFTLKAVGSYASGNVEGSQYAFSVDYAMDAWGFTAFYNDESGLEYGSDTDFNDANGALEGDQWSTSAAYGIGVSYDLGGGASVVGGYAYNSTEDASTCDDTGRCDEIGGIWDLGIDMSF